MPPNCQFVRMRLIARRLRPQLPQDQRRDPIAAFGHASNRGLGVVDDRSLLGQVQHANGSDVIQSTSRCLAPCQPIVHDQQRLLCFQRQLYRLDVSDSKARWMASPCGYGYHIQPSLARGLFDPPAVRSCFLHAFEPHCLRDPDAGEQVSWNQQRVGLGKGDQRPGVAYDASHAETSLASLLVVSSRRTISMPRLPR